MPVAIVMAAVLTRGPTGCLLIVSTPPLQSQNVQSCEKPPQAMGPEACKGLRQLQVWDPGCDSVVCVLDEGLKTPPRSVKCLPPEGERDRRDRAQEWPVGERAQEWKRRRWREAHPDSSVKMPFLPDIDTKRLDPRGSIGNLFRIGARAEPPKVAGDCMRSSSQAGERFPFIQ